MRKLRRRGSDEMRRRVRALTTLTDVDELEESIDALEVAVAENADLAVALAEQVSRTERAALRILARAERGDAPRTGGREGEEWSGGRG